MALWPSYNSMKMMAGMMFVVLVGMHQVSRMLQDVGPPKKVGSHHWNDTVRRLEEQHRDSDDDEDNNGGDYTHGKTRVVSNGVLLIEDMKQRLDVVQVNALQSKQEMEQMRARVMELEQDLDMFKHHLSESIEFRPLKSPELSKHLEQGERFDGHTHHYFMSQFKGRGMKQGPPEFFCFPSLLPSAPVAIAAATAAAAAAPSSSSSSSQGLSSSCYGTNQARQSSSSLASSFSASPFKTTTDGDPFKSCNGSTNPQAASLPTSLSPKDTSSWQEMNGMQELSPSSCNDSRFSSILQAQPSISSSTAVCQGSNIIQQQQQQQSSSWHEIREQQNNNNAYYASQQKLLCLKGNHTSDGSQNSYGFAFRHGLPQGSAVVAGTTLISDTVFDFSNPWHSMYNLLQFVYWRLESKCSRATQLLLFHKAEYRSGRQMGSWIRQLMNASGLPTSVLPIPIHSSSSSSSSSSSDVVCLQHAVVSRSGIGGMTLPLLRRMYTEARCRARLTCNIHLHHHHHHHHHHHVHVTLMLRRSGGRRFADEHAWQRVVEEQCKAKEEEEEEEEHHCTWSVMDAGNLTFCQQVEVMSHTDILISAHGGQLTNMIFMSPGGRVMEMFPGGWLEVAGRGQFVYKSLASWIGLHHEGYWRDTLTAPCPTPKDIKVCRSYYKDQPIGINVTHIGNWLREVIHRFQSMPLSKVSHSYQSINDSSNLTTCECND